jgi:hypothetical protein
MKNKNEVLLSDGNEVISRGGFRLTFVLNGGEVILKVQAEKGLAVFPKSGNTIIIKNVETPIL